MSDDKDNGFKGNLEGSKVLLGNSVVISVNTHTKTYRKLVSFPEE